ncbi:bifunctional U4-U6.U5 small nuclear ribonucleoprotein component Snu23/Matrin-U1-C-like [Babesia duncani]|uniref:Bifunctional U4-U6.U5 small nuclear ribonucleoprotein component Snu23/Matrin-U1-C-like n=1 Tax=Babesia duncani TaxID=323732 RepID=A0AAD9PP15_9APIC|nr:bifunctional U4-U6.U5 small nuclear ribonucleoprotein component Snu23/Matrin-U1-C-like [Babesia duncani]
MANSGDSTSSTSAPSSSKVDALGRKIWDKNYYAERALQKAGGQVENVEQTIASLINVPTRRPTVTVPEVRENLKRRNYAVDLTKEVGKSRVISAVAPKWEQGGFYCKLCDALLKDSQAYLDHLNGKKHNRMLGMTMRVEKVDAQTVAEKLKRLANQGPNERKTREELEREARERIMELEAQNRERQERKKQKKKIKMEQQSDLKVGNDIKLALPLAFKS